MNKNNIFAKIAAGLMLLIFIIYISVQVASFFKNKVTTIDAALVSVSDIISSEGFFVRSQVLISAKEGQTPEYIAANGEKVSRGQNVALFFNSGSVQGEYEKIAALSQTISGLEYALKNVSGGMDIKKVDNLIYSQIAALSQDLSGGKVKSAQMDYPGLEQLITGRTGGEMAGSEYYTAQINQLQNEKERLQTSIMGQTSAVSAEKSGYFIHGADGFENSLTPESIKNMSPETFDALAPNLTVANDNIGSVVDSYEWYFITVIDKTDADRFKEKATIDIAFPQINEKAITVTVESVKSYGDKAVAIFKSGIMKSAYLSERWQPIDIIVKNYTGIKVPKEALRRQGEDWGVYCFNGATSQFKKITWVYQTDTYYLVQVSNKSGGLLPHDKIIIKGKDIEDGKVLR